MALSAAQINAGAAATSDEQVITGTGWLCGWSLRETAAAAAVVIFRDGTTDTDKVLAVVNLAASASETIAFGNSSIDALMFRDGLFMEIASGSVQGAAYVA